ncbi:hypothetical protein TD95_003568 [Thielaviopsis punctulata]|uniref:Kelch domain-containing protein n=1 Tax=Thielaviopsis punctulata TaxID=72032 RepID=A0A0F4ZB81_9PEZI|nr:hypothetical protein TD95_003568 [Thielaviopsis punctulata]
MQSFAALKRRTTNVLQSLPQTLPSLPSRPTRPVNGSWAKIDGVAPLPRSSHSLDVVGGSAYIFGGQAGARQPVDNAMHVIGLPYSGASADSYVVEAQPMETETSKASEPIVKDILTDDEGGGISGAETETTEETNTDSESEEGTSKKLTDIPLDSATPTPIATTPTVPYAPKVAAKKKPSIKDKGKAIEEFPALDLVPAPRVGHATAVIGNRVFMFGGRGGPAMIPLDEGGRVWIFDTRVQRWTFLDPASPAPGVVVVPRPSPRANHIAVGLSTPRDFKPLGPRRTSTWAEWAAGNSAEVGTPQAPIVGNIAARATDEDDEGYGTFIVHGGCMAGAGMLTGDVWAFDVRSCVWSQLPVAPGPARAGPALCASLDGHRLFRFGGYDGKGEIGGQIDILTLAENHDTLEPTLRAAGEWTTVSQPVRTDGKPEVLGSWPAPRSVMRMVAVNASGKETLVLFMGEKEPSPKGVLGAGKFLDDVWVYTVPTGKNAEGKWAHVNTRPYDDDESNEMPVARGWMAAAPMTQIEENAVVMWGGLREDNQCHGDGWIFRLE